MSQRWFNSGRLEVLTGWDRPTQRFFFSVFDPNIPKDEDDLIFDSEFSYLSIATAEDVVAQLKTRGIVSPQTLAADLEGDRQGNVGNLVHSYS